MSKQQVTYWTLVRRGNTGTQSVVYTREIGNVSELHNNRQQRVQQNPERSKNIYRDLFRIFSNWNAHNDQRVQSRRLYLGNVFSHNWRG